MFKVKGSFFWRLLFASAVPSLSFAQHTTSTLQQNSVDSLGTAQASYGIERLNFGGAPNRQDIAFDNLSLGYVSPSLVSVAPGVNLHAGLSAHYLSMRGEIGPGLKSLSGYGFLPQAQLSYSTDTMLTPFLSVGYRWTSLRGRGSEEWAESSAASLVLYRGDTTVEGRKNYRSFGPTLGLGTALAVAPRLALNARYDLGFNTLTHDGRDFVDGREIELGDRSFSRSHTFSLGAGFSL